jgi:hypothetical protein
MNCVSKSEKRSYRPKNRSRPTIENEKAIRKKAASVGGLFFIGPCLRRLGKIKCRLSGAAVSLVMTIKLCAEVMPI